MNIRTLFLGLALGSGVLLAACGGGTTVTGPTPGPTCGPANIQSELIYPQPSATGVTDNLAQIVIAVSSPLPINTFNLALTALNNGGGTALTANPLAQISASQLPAGSATATIPNPTYEAVNLIANLPSATQIQTAINDPGNPNNCTPQNIPNGTFTTQ